MARVPRSRTTSDEAILAATGRAIARYGLPKLTLATVAREADLSPATLVQRFGSKRGLLLAFAEQAPPGASAPFQRARRGRGSPLAALRAAIATFASAASRGELANHLTFLHMDLTDPEFLGHARRHAEVMRTEITTLLAEAVTAGELDPTTDIDRLARAVHVTYHGSLIGWALTGDGTLAEALATNLHTLLTPYLKGERWT